MAAKKTVQQAFEEIFTRLVALEDPEPNSRDRLKFEQLINEQQVVYNLLMELPLSLFEANPMSYGTHKITRTGTEIIAYEDYEFNKLVEDNSIHIAPILTADGTLLYTKDYSTPNYVFPAPGLTMAPLGVDVAVMGTGPDGAGMKKLAATTEYKLEDGKWYYRSIMSLDFTGGENTPEKDPTLAYTEYRDAKVSGDAAAIAEKAAAITALGPVGTVQLVGFAVAIPVEDPMFKLTGKVNMLKIFSSISPEPIQFFGVAANGSETELQLEDFGDKASVEAAAEQYTSVKLKIPWFELLEEAGPDMSAQRMEVILSAITFDNPLDGEAAKMALALLGADPESTPESVQQELTTVLANAPHNLNLEDAALAAASAVPRAVHAAQVLQAMH